MNARIRRLAAALVLACGTPAAALAAATGTGTGPLHCTTSDGSSLAELARLADETRANDSFYRQLLKWQGMPSACAGSIGSGATEGESWLAFSWPDGATFEQSALLPETSIVRYGNPNGIARADEALASLRDYAARRGLRIDWSAPHATDDPAAVEYQDPDPGVNGLARVTYDERRRLVEVALSIAL